MVANDGYCGNPKHAQTETHPYALREKYLEGIGIKMGEPHGTAMRYLIELVHLRQGQHEDSGVDSVKAAESDLEKVLTIRHKLYSREWTRDKRILDRTGDPI